MPDVLREDQHRVRGSQVPQLGPARTEMTQPNLALARPQNPATLRLLCAATAAEGAGPAVALS